MNRKTKRELISAISFLNQLLSRIGYKYDIDIQEEARLKRDYIERLRNEIQLKTIHPTNK